MHCLDEPEAEAFLHGIRGMGGEMGVVLTDEQLEGKVVAGVDTHADTHWLCVLDGLRRVAVSAEFPATAEGYAELATAIGDPGMCAAVGVEGTCSYGAGLTDELQARGFTVLEVLRPKRDGKRRPGEGKDDAGDAERAARDVLAGKVTSVPKQRGGWVEELRALDVARGRCVKARKESLAAARSLVSTAPDRQRRRWEGMSADKMMSAMAAVDGDEASALERSLLSIARVWDAARREADALEGEMGAVLERNCPALLAMFCCGVDDAAALAIAAGENTGRFKDEASFAKHCGVAPIPASSGKTSGRMRLNRGGDRSANSALHLIVTRRIRFDPETQRYVERRCSGKGALSKREAIRCLKRYVAREAFHALTHPFDVPEPERDGQGLKEARRSAGIRQRQVAEAIGVTSACISNIETGKVSNRSRAFRLYAEWVGNGMPLDVGAEESDGEICG